jgi:hypothetical protein
MGKKFLTTDQQEEEVGILSPEVRARLASRTQRWRAIRSRL